MDGLGGNAMQSRKHVKTRHLEGNHALDNAPFCCFYICSLLSLALFYSRVLCQFMVLAIVLISSKLNNIWR